MEIREMLQERIARSVEQKKIDMFEQAIENYRIKESQSNINEYSSFLSRTELSFQFRIAFLRPSEQKELYDTFFKGGRLL